MYIQKIKPTVSEMVTRGRSVTSFWNVISPCPVCIARAAGQLSKFREQLETPLEGSAKGVPSFCLTRRLNSALCAKSCKTESHEIPVLYSLSFWVSRLMLCNAILQLQKSQLHIVVSCRLQPRVALFTNWMRWSYAQVTVLTFGWFTASPNGRQMWQSVDLYLSLQIRSMDIYHLHCEGVCIGGFESPSLWGSCIEYSTCICVVLSGVEHVNMRQIGMYWEDKPSVKLSPGTESEIGEVTQPGKRKQFWNERNKQIKWRRYKCNLLTCWEHCLFPDKSF